MSESKCPVNHGKQAEAASKCPVPHGAAAARSEPPDTPDRELTSHPRFSALTQGTGKCPVAHGKGEAGVGVAASSSDPEKDPLNYVPDATIPAAGRGNSEDGRHWVNPSAAQLYRALKRKQKPIHLDDALDVSATHNAVVDQSWQLVMEYENMHRKSCAEGPTLKRFQGMDGHYTVKALITHYLFGQPLPFDRHDWVVDRCGVEHRYIIDYYEYADEPAPGAPEQQPEVAYSIDARPAVTFTGVADRLRMAWRRYWNGESVW